MFELLLIRHAIAHEHDRKRWRDDDLRPLSSVGRKKFRRVAQAMAALTDVPDAVWSSPLLRARQTAQLLQEAAGWPPARECAPLAPPGTADAVVDFLKKQSAARIALVGHEPNLSALAAHCLHGSGGVRIEMKKGAVACLRFPRRARAGMATLLWLAPPRLFMK